MDKKLSLGILALVLIVVLLVSGCTQTTSKTEVLSKAVSADVWVFGENWDGDAEEDGVIIYPALKDAIGETVHFSGVELTVKIEAYTLKYETSAGYVKDRLLFSGNDTIDNWEDGNPLMGGGIMISYDYLETTEEDERAGRYFVKIHLPDGRVLEAATDSFAPIKPEKL